MERVYESAKEAYQRYSRTDIEHKEILGEQILDTIDSQIDQVLKIWMDVFAEEYDSKLFQELYNWRFKELIK